MTPEEWDSYCHWRDEFHDVLDERYYTMDWLDGEILSGRALFLANDKGAIVYEYKRYPTGAVDIHGLIAAGELDTIRTTLIPAAVERGRSLNCLAAIISSRPGWAKALKEDGFEVHQVEIRKPL